MEDTIAAISTALGVGAISIIRISGNKSIEIINKVFDKDLTNANSHTIHYGHIIDHNEIIDEVLCAPSQNALRANAMFCFASWKSMNL